MEALICICCGDKWETDYYNFYNLCYPCFTQFDRQKMSGRFGTLGFASKNNNQQQQSQQQGQDETFYTESSKLFAESGRCTHQRKITFIEHFETKIDNGEKNINLLGFIQDC